MFGRFLNLLFITATLYLGSYAFLVQPKPQTVVIHIAKDEFRAKPTYRFLSEAHPKIAEVAGDVYQPLFVLDRHLRPDYWRPVTLGYVPASL